MNASNMAIGILHNTSDGNDLAPSDLKLLESAVNGFLTEEGEVAFQDLHKRVTSGEYRKPWLHGVEHLTIDHNGYVYWKDQEIEHWSGSLPYSNDGQEAALELGKRCRILEQHGEPVSCCTVIWKWIDPGMSLNDVLARLGLTTEKAGGNYRKHIRSGDETLFTGQSHEVWAWLKETGRIPKWYE